MSIINHTHYELKENLKIENGKNIEQKITKPKVRCQQNKIDAQKDKNKMTMEGINALYAETKLLEKTVNFTDYVKLKQQKLFLRATKCNMDAVFNKISIFDKPDDLFAADIISDRQCMNR